MFPLARTLTVAGAVFVPAAGIFWYQHLGLAATAAQNNLRLVQIQALGASAADVRSKTSETRSETRRREEELERLTAGSLASSPSATNQPNLAASPPSPDPGRVALSKENLSRLRLKAFTPDYRLTDEGAAVLGMSPAERHDVNAALSHLIEQHERLDLAKVKQIDQHLTSAPGRKTTFRVPAYPEEGQALAAEVQRSVLAAIGPERTRILTAYANLGTLSADGFEPFGRMEKTITFLDRYAEDGSRGDCQIHLRIADPSGGIALSTSFANTADEIPPNWRHLIQNVAPKPQP